jgi:predicted metalloenzyme YecM
MMQQQAVMMDLVFCRMDAPMRLLVTMTQLRHATMALVSFQMDVPMLRLVTTMQMQRATTDHVCIRVALTQPH